MCKLRDLVVFMAGAEFFHTLNHAALPFFVNLPLDLKFMSLTQNMNGWAIGINAAITIGLLFWAANIKQGK